ncbi:uncharacterized protein LOC143068092 [Mytilus galloprovincialis]|uniref:uncharacterized protein LOC143068092 n=1 Tax=Mytilus galloprovincialis TaxID=29158 RepID=UPI003F7BA7D2
MTDNSDIDKDAEVYVPESESYTLQNEVERWNKDVKKSKQNKSDPPIFNKTPNSLADEGTDHRLTSDESAGYSKDQPDISEPMNQQHKTDPSIEIRSQTTDGVTINVGQVDTLRQVTLNTGQSQPHDIIPSNVRHFQLCVCTGITSVGILYYNSHLLSESCSLLKNNVTLSLQSEAFVSALRRACFSNSMVFPLILFILLVVMIVFVIPAYFWDRTRNQQL